MSTLIKKYLENDGQDEDELKVSFFLSADLTSKEYEEVISAINILAKYFPEEVKE